MYPYLLAAGNLTVTFPNGKSRTLSKAESEKYFNLALEAIKSGEWDSLEDLFDKSKAVQSFIDSGKSEEGSFILNGGTIYFECGGLAEEVPDVLSNKVIEFMDMGFPFRPLELFWQNLRQNPSFNSRKCLYAYLEHNKYSITDDGCFIAYKGVGSNFKDLHTGRVDNTPGLTVKMDRALVDDDITHTCSAGLHCTNFHYAQNNYGGGKLIMLKVNPRDVVAVPYQYDNEKMRVCEYLVLQEVEKEFKSEYYPDYAEDLDDEYDHECDEDCDDDCECEAPCDECDRDEEEFQRFE